MIEHGIQLAGEWRIIAALRDEATAAEMRLEEERAAHTNTQRTAAAREQVGAVPAICVLLLEAAMLTYCVVCSTGAQQQFSAD